MCVWCAGLLLMLMIILVVLCGILYHTTLPCNKRNSPSSQEFFARSFFLQFFFTLVRFTFMSTVIFCMCMKMGLFFFAIFSASLNFFCIYLELFLTFRLWCRTTSSIMIWLPLKRNVLFSFSLFPSKPMYWWFCDVNM